ncbi:796_t:CDS:2, partial [Acaulospora colombiana]
MVSFRKSKSFENDNKDQPEFEFIEFGSFAQLTPLTTRKSGNQTDDDGRGKIFWAIWGNDRIPVVLKSVKFNAADEKNIEARKENKIENGTREKSDERDPSVTESILNELKLLSRVIHHPNITEIFGLTEVPELDDLFVVTQYTTGGNLRQYLKQQNSILSWNDRIRFSKEIASGLR